MNNSKFICLPLGYGRPLCLMTMFGDVTRVVTHPCYVKYYAADKVWLLLNAANFMPLRSSVFFVFQYFLGPH